MLEISQRLRAKPFDEFYREHYQLVYRTAYTFLHKREDAEDVCQIVFARILAHDDHTEIARNIHGYLYRAAVNEARRLLQSRKRREPLTDGDLEGLFSESTTVLEDEMRLALRDAIEKLRPEYSLIVNLHYVEGCSDVEIARRLGMSRIKVAVSLFRARAQLKKLMRSSPALRGAYRQRPTNELSLEGDIR